MRGAPGGDERGVSVCGVDVRGRVLRTESSLREIAFRWFGLLSERKVTPGRASSRKTSWLGVLAVWMCRWLRWTTANHAVLQVEARPNVAARRREMASMTESRRRSSQLRPGILYGAFHGSQGHTTRGRSSHDPRNKLVVQSLHVSTSSKSNVVHNTTPGTYNTVCTDSYKIKTHNNSRRTGRGRENPGSSTKRAKKWEGGELFGLRVYTSYKELIRLRTKGAQGRSR